MAKYGQHSSGCRRKNWSEIEQEDYIQGLTSIQIQADLQDTKVGLHGKKAKEDKTRNTK